MSEVHAYALTRQAEANARDRAGKLQALLVTHLATVAEGEIEANFDNDTAEIFVTVDGGDYAISINAYYTEAELAARIAEGDGPHQ